jgi:hypothetical protein
MLQVFHTHVLSVSSFFFCMLQVLYVDVSKVDHVLHMGCAWEAEGGRERSSRVVVPWATSGVARVLCWGARSQVRCY